MTLTQISPQYIFAVSLCIIGVLILNGYFLKIITQPFGVTIKNHFWLSSTTSLLNFITPFRGGALFRIWYLRKKYNLDFTKILITIIGSYPVVFLVNSLLGLLCVITFIHKGATIPLWGVIFFIGSFLGTIALINIPQAPFKKLNKLNKVIKGWQQITKNKKILYQCFFNQFLLALIIALSLWIIFQGINHPISFTDALLISVFATFALILNITPSGIGITEAFFVLGGMLVNIPPDIMLLSAIIQRGLMILVLFPTGILGKFLLIKTLNF